MTPTELYLAAIAGRSDLITATTATLASLLRGVAADIAAQLARQPSDFQRWYLPELAAEVRRMLAELAGDAGMAVAGAAGEAWRLGEGLADDGLRVSGLRLALPRLDSAQLVAMRAFATERITGITLEVGNRINTELGRVVIGAQTPFQAVESVSQILGETTLKRANTIVHTQLAQAHSAATQLRMEQIASDAMPELEKRWIKSGKREPRLNHAVINGQVQPAGSPFKLNGGRLLMMCPHDPAAPIGEVINCGCISVPVVPKVR